ncbi:hypothetical protein NKH55_09285 [Mesorhizobium opportunistum]|uniref:hypothetical protein n=1 Tax=Mesorhizobium opportunistum TaxID=593909 RepID=UPI003335E463
MCFCFDGDNRSPHTGRRIAASACLARAPHRITDRSRGGHALPDERKVIERRAKASGVVLRD